MVSGAHSVPLPRRPLLDWSSFAGPWETPWPGIQDLAHVRMTTSGRAAIYQALCLADLPAGSTVLVPTYHCPTMIAPAALLDLDCAFYPLADDGLPQLSAIPEATADAARVMLVAHLFGVAQSLAPVRAWCDQHDILLIEDCAHTLYGLAGNRPVGAWGDFAVASLSKFLPVSEGGLLASHHRPLPPLALEPAGMGAQIKGLFDVVQVATEHGRLRGLGFAVRALRAMRRQRAPSPPAEMRPSPTSARRSLADEIEACDLERRRREPLLSTRLLAHLPQARMMSQRRANYARYLASMDGLPGVRPVVPALPATCAPYVFPLWVDDAQRVYHALRDAGAPVFKWDALWPGTPALPDDHGALWSRHVVQLLCHQSLGETDIDWICQQLIEQLHR